MSDLYTVTEAASYLRMSAQALYRAIREKQIPRAAIIRIGTRIRINPAVLLTSTHDETKTGKANRPFEKNGDDQ